MYKPGNLHKIMKYTRSKENVFNVEHSLLDSLLECFKSSPSAPLHRWCHGSSDTYKESCNIWKKVENANKDNNY